MLSAGLVNRRSSGLEKGKEVGKIVTTDECFTKVCSDR